MKKQFIRFKIKDMPGFTILRQENWESMPLWWKEKFLELFRETTPGEIPVVFGDEY